MKGQHKLASCAVCILVLLIVSGLLALARGGLTTRGSNGDERAGNGDEEPLLKLHHDLVTGATWNHDETQIMTWSYSDGTVRVWDAQSGDELLTLRHFDQPYQITAAAWNPAETLIVTSAGDGFVRLWDATTGDLLLVLDHDGFVDGVAWGRDGMPFLAWSYTDGAVRVWAVQWSGGELAATEQLNLKHPAIGAAWSPNETHILSRSPDGTLMVWDAQTGDVLSTFQCGDVVDGAVWSRDGARILTWTGSRAIHVWDVEGGTESLRLKHEAPPGSDYLQTCCAMLKVTWTEDETRILSYFVSDKNLRVWNAASSDLLFTLQGDSSNTSSVASSPPWNPDGAVIAIRDGASIFYAASSHILIVPDILPDNVVWNADQTRALVVLSDEVAVYEFELPGAQCPPGTLTSKESPTDISTLTVES
jgi:WD40 repeat protein